MKLFVAVYPPEEALDHLAAAMTRSRLGAATAAGTTVGLIPRSRWHITLTFLGEVDADRAPAAEAALREGVARWRTHGTARPNLRLAGAGRFGRRRFTVFWVGLAGDVETLRSVDAELRRELRRGRVPYDRKPLKPHLTVARPGDRLPADDLAADLTTLRDYEGPEWTAQAVHLVRSHPGPKPVYEPLATVPISPAAS